MSGQDRRTLALLVAAGLLAAALLWAWAYQSSLAGFDPYG